jgi:hypothetical protein
MRKRLGFYGQMARGRAIARTHRMKDARRAAAALKRLEAGITPPGIAAGALRTPLSVELRYGLGEDRLRAFVAEMLRKEVAFHVRMARDANRAWREYRRTHNKLEVDDV